MSKISIIVAASTNNVIGKANDIPWRLPTDLKNFKRITDGSVVIMGRKCWDSLPDKFKPLPNRFNIVLSKNKTFKPEGVVVYDSLDYILNFFNDSDNKDEVFVIGGSDIYKTAFNFANKVYLTRVLMDVEGDVYLEGFNLESWVLTYRSDIISENGLQFVFEEYNKGFIYK